jgi:hypothetical protein
MLLNYAYVLIPCLALGERGRRDRGSFHLLAAFDDFAYESLKKK